MVDYSQRSAARGDLAEQLLAGPRGRRMLLEFAKFSEAVVPQTRNEGTLSELTFDASYQLDPAWGTPAMVVFVGGEELSPGDPAVESVGPRDVAERLHRVVLADVDPLVLNNAMLASVDDAMYWQPPSGEDVLASAEELTGELRRVAEHVATSELTAMWNAPSAGKQYAVSFEDRPHQVTPVDQTATVLKDWRSQAIRAEAEMAPKRWRRHRPTSGEWWSGPSWVTPQTTGIGPDGSPFGLWFVEDSFGWETGTTTRVVMLPAKQVFEIQSADDWAYLCRRFPVTVTYSKGPDWERTTGRSGGWVVPDWYEVAQNYSGVHLTIAAYFALAGVSIDVGNDLASVIAGWAPDQTIWFTPDLRYIGEEETWDRVRGEVEPEFIHWALRRTGE